MIARILDCTPAEYHRDPCPTPSLSSSIAHTLLTKSPEHAWLEHPKLGGAVRETTRELETGTLVHELLLNAGRGIHVIDAENYRTKAAQALRDHNRSLGRVPVLKHEFEEIQVVVTELRKRLDASGIRFEGRSELAVTWGEELTHGGTVACRGMMDHVILDRGVVYDLKTIRSAHPRVCARHMVEYGYDIQWAAYTSAIGKLHPELAGRVDFVFLFCELDPPFSVTPARPSGAMRELGRARWDRAVELWAHCLIGNKWPGYVEGIIDLEPPPWALAAEMGSAA